MAGPTLNPDSINSNGQRIYSAAYTFSGGGTQTVLTLAPREVWLLYAYVYNYGGTDFRHGDMVYVARTNNGSPSTYLRMRNSSLPLRTHTVLLRGALNRLHHCNTLAL